MQNFSDYLKMHKAVVGSEITHTRIGDKDKNIFGGSYNISNEEWEDFMQRYYKHVFVNGKIEYLTEKQLIQNGPILIDIDFRYEKNIIKKQHTPSHIIDAVMLYADKIQELLVLPNGTEVEVFVMEKSGVNILDTKTKDGIHILIGLKMHKGLQLMLRERVLPELKNMWEDLPITNSWDDVLDEGVTRASCNWQIYGSRKPNHDAYLLRKHFVIILQNNYWDIKEKDIASFSVEKNILKLSARYTNYPDYPMHEKHTAEFNEKVKGLTKKESSLPKKKLIIIPAAEQEVEEVKLSLHEQEGIELLNATDAKYFTDYKDWYKITSAIGNTFKLSAKSIAHKYSQKTSKDNYEEDAVDKILENAEKTVYDIDTLRLYAKKSNNSKFVEIRTKYKELEKRDKFLIKEFEKKHKEEKLERERELLLNDESNLIAKNDTEAAALIYKQIKDNFIYSKKKHYYKHNYKWIDDEKAINALLLVYITESGIHKLDKTQLIDYVQNKKEAKYVLDLIWAKAVTNADDEWTAKMFSSSLGKILFTNGYYNFHTSTFYTFADKDFDHSIIFIESIPYPYIKPANDIYKNEVKKKMFTDPFNQGVDDYYILNLARGLAGDAMKRMLFGIGDGNTGKSSITTAISSSCGGYYGSFNGNNIVKKKFKNPDDAQSLRWVMLLAHKRIIISNEIGKDPVDGEIMKKLASGGKDEITARGHGGNETAYKISFLPIVFANDINISTNDVNDSAIKLRARAIPYTKVYVDTPTDSNLELKIDLNFDTEINTPEFKNAFMTLLMDAYKNMTDEKEKCKQEQKQWIETEPPQIKTAYNAKFGEGIDYIELFLENFEITSQKDDFIKNEEIQNWITEKKYEISLTKFSQDLNKYLISNKIENVENKPKRDGKKLVRGWFGIKSE